MTEKWVGDSVKNAVKVLVRDLRRFARVPQAILILIGIIIIPSLYAWLNIVAFWDPYSNTKDVNVAIVNLDRGASSSFTGKLNVGDQVVAQLKQNDQLGWQFMGEKEGLDAVKSGEVFATIVLQPDFSKDVLSLTTGSFVKPEIQYYVNEKANAITPKITDTGASTLETQINSTFVSTVSQSIAETIEQAGGDLGDKLKTAQSSSAKELSAAVNQLGGARKGIGEIQEALGDGSTAVADARGALLSVNTTIDELQSSLIQTEQLVADVQAGLMQFSNSITSAVLNGSSQLAAISAKINQKMAAISGDVSAASGAVSTALDQATVALDRTDVLLQDLRAYTNSLPPGDPERTQLESFIDELQTQYDADAQLLTQLTQLNGEVSQVSAELEAAAAQMNAAVQDAADAAGSVHGILSETLPKVNQAMHALSASAGGFSAALNAQKVLNDQAIALLGEFENQLATARNATSSLDGNLATTQKNLQYLRADVTALGAAGVWQQLADISSLNPTQIADFMASPVKVKEHILFPVATYGSAMAPLFTNLSLWIAAFVLVVLLKQEVDAEGIEGLTVREAYLGRWMLFAVINFFQALLVSVGNVVIGVQMASAIAYVLTSLFVGFVYMALIYALAVSFGYVGKGMVILLVIMQIPGASGIYPIQMMPEFFRTLFPFFPFTYGIDAMRETIGGFYDGNYWRSIAVLAVFAVLACLLGLFFRQRLGNFARLFNRKLSDTGLFVSENVQILGSKRRVTQLVEAITNHAKFNAKTMHQAKWFAEHHVTMIRITVISGLFLTALLLIVSWLIPDAKATVLGLWGLLCFITVALLVTLEYLKQNIAFATKLRELGTQELKQRLEHEESATHSNTELASLKSGGPAHE